MEIKPFPWPKTSEEFSEALGHYFEFHIPAEPPTVWDLNVMPLRCRNFSTAASEPELYQFIVDCGLASFLQSGKGSHNIVAIQTYTRIDAPWQLAFVGDYIYAGEDPWVWEGKAGPIDIIALVNRPWYVVIKKPNNPIEVHWTRYPKEVPQITAINLGLTDNPNHHKAIPKMIAILVTSVKRGGGPKPVPVEEKIKAVNAWRNSQGRKLKFVIAREIGISERQLSRWEEELVEMGLLPPRKKK